MSKLLIVFLILISIMVIYWVVVGEKRFKNEFY